MIKKDKVISEADKMFIDLGFQYDDDHDDYAIYTGRGIQIIFQKERKAYNIIFDNIYQAINVEIHNAISEKIKELGWNNA